MYLSFHYTPDLSAGSFRNRALSKVLSEKLGDQYLVHLVCTQPNRYKNVIAKQPSFQREGNLLIHRVDVPQHGNSFFRQLLSFWYYRKAVLRISSELPLRFAFVSTSKLFTGYLAREIAKKKKIPYYLDLRDLFAENLRELIRIPVLNGFISTIVRNQFQLPMLIEACHININSEGFRESIPESYKGSTSFFPNGIDDEFNHWHQAMDIPAGKKIICYAGNIGEGQGLDKIIPELAIALESTHDLIIIGEGSAKNKLRNRLKAFKVTNVKLLPAMPRQELLGYYQNAHYLFLHLNDFKSFEKVLPSKVFEFAAGDLPILAGVQGYAREFIKNEVRENIFIFNPCEATPVIEFLHNSSYSLKERTDFNRKYGRKEITGKMTDSIIKVLIRECEQK